MGSKGITTPKKVNSANEKLKRVFKGMKSEEIGTTYKCKMWREKVRTSRNQFELNHRKDNNIFFRPDFFKKGKKRDYIAVKKRQRLKVV